MDIDAVLNYTCECLGPNTTDIIVNTTGLDLSNSTVLNGTVFHFLIGNITDAIPSIGNESYEWLNLSTNVFNWTAMTKDNCSKFDGNFIDIGCKTPRFVPDAFFLSVLLFLGTYIIASTLTNAKTSAFFPTFIRQTLSDFAVLIAIITMVVVDVLLGIHTPKLEVPTEFKAKKVGLLDADIFGPSVPTLMSLSGRPEVNNQNLMLPLMNYGVKCMSMGFLVEKTSAVVWRGLMVMSAIQKLLRNVLWGPLDYLIIDMPPGTGDVQLSITQNIPVSGSIVVTTPQDLALIDARRAVDMFRQVNVPNLGIIENMSVFVCPKCNHHEHIFGQEGGQSIAKEIGSEILGSIPLVTNLCSASDQGQPIVISRPEDPVSLIFKTIADKVISKLP